MDFISSVQKDQGPEWLDQALALSLVGIGFVLECDFVFLAK